MFTSELQDALVRCIVRSSCQGGAHKAFKTVSSDSRPTIAVGWQLSGTLDTCTGPGLTREEPIIVL